MTQGTEEVLKQIDTVLRFQSEYRQHSRHEDLSDLPDMVTSEVIARLAATVDRLAPDGSIYKQNAQKALHQYGVSNAFNIPLLSGILRALRADYAAGFMQTIQELVHADLFADFYEMSEYLLSEGYKDAAAVMIGGVIEEHLRKLCVKGNIPVQVNGKPKKADLMNAELAAANIYSKLDQKSLTAWLDLRNRAAHGKYSDYSKDQVSMMITAHREFVSRYPA